MVSFYSISIGINSSIILIATKLDLLQNKFKKGLFENGENETNQKLIKINNEINKTIIENKIKIKFHKFNQNQVLILNKLNNIKPTK